MMKKILTAVLALALCAAMLLPLHVCASGENPVPEAKKGVICITAGIYYGDDGQPRTYDGSYGTGTGFGVGLSGKYADTFVTNCHVVANDQMEHYDTVYVCIDGASIYDKSTVIEAKVIYADPKVDLAIIQTASAVPGVTTLPLLPSESMETGDRVYALGFPGIADAVADSNQYTVEDITVTDGVLSRYLTSEGRKEIAHTADINSGNSGGPLINELGQVVGINTHILYSTAQNAAPDLRGYAIYIDYAMDALDQLGITYTDASKAPAQKDGNLLPVLAIAAAGVAVAVLVIVLGKKKSGGKAAYSIYACSGPMQGSSWPLSKTVQVGRDPSCTIVYPANTTGISRNHCRFEVHKGEVTLTDLGSSYGTYIGGRRISPNMPVQIGKNTEICIGSEQVRLMLR